MPRHNNPLLTTHGQAVIETVMGLIAGMILLVGAAKVWTWLDTVIVERQEEYQKTRVAAASTTPGIPNHYGPPLLSIFGEFSGQVPLTSGGGVVPRSPCTDADPLIAQAELLIAQAEALWAEADALLAQAEQLYLEVQDLFKQADALTKQIDLLKQQINALQAEIQQDQQQIEAIIGASYDALVLVLANTNNDWSQVQLLFRLSDAELAEVQQLYAEIQQDEADIVQLQQQIEDLKLQRSALLLDAKRKQAQADLLIQQSVPLTQQASDLENQAADLISQSYQLCGRGT
ncbi:MAG: hypothetical protein HY597_03665 [Candidatus Omnitrophica bacterium]|nr:hypothetical protein [Candidatus Omnitrophota bacterium]